MTTLYIDLIARLRTDAAAAVTTLRRVREGAEAPTLTGADVAAQQDSQGRWHAFAPLAVGTLDGGFGADSEVEALCALVEFAQDEAIDAHALGVPLHVLDQAAHLENVVATYRAAVRRAVSRGLVALADLHGALDMHAAEGWLPAGDVEALLAMAGKGK